MQGQADQVAIVILHCVQNQMDSLSVGRAFRLHANREVRSEILRYAQNDKADGVG
jgi:hypothetical protein